jgi:hypothetical protein
MNHLPIRLAMTAPKPTLIGKTVDLTNWEMSEVSFFLTAMNWLDDNFYYMLKAEAETLTFFIFHVK